MFFMSDQLYVSQIITLKKEFLMKIHAHELLAEIKGINIDNPDYIEMWKNTPEISEHSFGGAYGTQFTSIEQYVSFSAAFEKVLIKNKIDAVHENPLLYIISFLGEDHQKQSLDMNEANRLMEYTRFILDLQTNCSSHFEAMMKNKEYQRIYDEHTAEYFFAKKMLVDKIPLEEICEYRPNDTPGDLVQYLRVRIFQTELYVPRDLNFSVISDRNLRSFEGEAIPNIAIPPYLQSEILKFTIDYMLDEHKRNNTDFYKALNTPGLSRSDVTKFYNQYKKHNISYTQSMLRVGMAVSDYLLANKLSKNKSSVAAFLFDYFSLFKVIPLKNKVEFPIEYSELPNFYNRNGVTKETIRYMMKDAVIVGGI
jgi:hypothetical protein